MPVDLISVVVAVYNGEKTIAKTMAAILSQDFSAELEVIVVDDGSTDRTSEILATFTRHSERSEESNPDEILRCCAPQNDKISILYFRQTNQGPASARNKGAECAKGEIIFFTDSDCVPAPDWIKTNIAHYSDPTVAVVAGSYDILNNESLLARCIHAEIIFRHQVLMPLYPKVFGSYNFSIRKKIFNQVGGFNTDYRYPSGEDNDLSYKVIQTGYKIYFARDSLVAHDHPTKLWRYLEEQYRHGFWRVKMYADHPSMSRGDDYTFWKDIVEIPIVLLLILSPILILFKNLLYIVILFNFLLYLIEFYYGFIMTRQLPEGFFLSCVMWLRSFARSFGFSSGIFYFFSKKILKKSK